MKSVLGFMTVLIFLAGARPCAAVMSIENVSTARAKQMGIQLTATANGPREAWIKLEFRPQGELKDFQHVSLEVRDGEKFLLGWTPLRDKRTSSGAVAVSLMANRAFLENVSLRIVTGAMGDVGRDLRIKDFVDLKQLR
jgi:hypothetical protein